MGTTFLKRQKEMKRMEKQREKAERRAQKKAQGNQPQDENSVGDLGSDDTIMTREELATMNMGPGDAFEITSLTPKI